MADIVAEEKQVSDSQYWSIVKTYLDTESVNAAAAELKISPVKVRRVLITEGLWSSRTSLEVGRYLSQGRSTAEIATVLCITQKVVQQYLPYTRGMYGAGNPSADALKSANYRERIRAALERTNKKSQALARQNGWQESPLEKEEMTGDGMTMDYQSNQQPIMLRLELACDGEAETLQKYGGVQHGSSISRDILVPADMPLWALHYAIQRCFEWQNSHLHCFELPNGAVETLCDGLGQKYMDLVGVIFRSPWMDEAEEFWADDYERGSFRTWLRKKYTGPYKSLCHGEGIWQCRRDAAEIQNRFRYVQMERSVGSNGQIFYQWPRAITGNEYETLKAKLKNGDIPRNESGQRRKVDRFFGREPAETVVFAFEEMPLRAMEQLFLEEANKLLERLRISEVFLQQEKSAPSSFDDVMTKDLLAQIRRCCLVDEVDVQPHLHGLTEELLYRYDFGDEWTVRITAVPDAADLLESGRLTQDELDAARQTAQGKYRPVCIAQDGMMVLDDVGGPTGYAQFLRAINQTPNQAAKMDADERYDAFGNLEDKEESLQWAKSMGWSKRKTGNGNLL